MVCDLHWMMLYATLYVFSLTCSGFYAKYRLYSDEDQYSYLLKNISHIDDGSQGVSYLPILLMAILYIRCFITSSTEH